jgi:hypothetical protein
VRVGAAPTTTGRVGTARRSGSGKRDGIGVRVQKPVVEPPQVQNRLQSGGYGPDSNARPDVGDSEAGEPGRWGGPRESLRRTDGDVAGEKLGASPVERSTVNVGTVPVPPFPPAIQVGGGQARGQLLGQGSGRALVVVRGRESRLHGEGEQSTRRCGVGRSGGRW